MTTVQAVLFFGNEIWTLAPVLLHSLKGFHVKTDYRMTGMIPNKKSDRTWEYSDLSMLLDAAGLHTVEAYVEVRRNIVFRFITDHPIYEP